MFTVMHEKMDGSQELFKAVSVQYLPFTEKNGNCAGLHLNSAPDENSPGVRCGVIRDGRVFVMNDQGATVGRFYLDRPEPAPETSNV